MKKDPIKIFLILNIGICYLLGLLELILKNGITYFGAYDEEKLVGLVGIRLKEGHICFFFVDGAYHRRGIGRSLFEFVKSRVYVRPITLNSSPYGLPFYNALGFKAVSAEQTVNGIRFTPMVFDEKTKMNDNLEGKL